jgi:hypothetical protein
MNNCEITYVIYETVATLNRALVGIPFNWPNNLGVLDSNWSTETQSPGSVMTILIGLGTAFVVHGRLVIMPNMHSWYLAFGYSGRKQPL